jgi:hypothetical protein
LFVLRADVVGLAVEVPDTPASVSRLFGEAPITLTISTDCAFTLLKGDFELPAAFPVIAVGPALQRKHS